MKLIKDLGMMYATKNSKHKQRFCLYECECGEQKTVCTYDINRGKGLKCFSCSQKKHGGSKSNLYSVWRNMKSRCNDSEHKSYKDYHDRGIGVSDEFMDFETYRSYVNELPDAYKDTYSIDRIDNDGNYERGNLRWASKSSQVRNTRRIYSTNTSGFRGVSFLKSANRFRATIRLGKKRKYLGQYKEAIDGARAYDKYVIANNLEHTINGV